MSKFKSTFDLLKRQDMWTSHFRGIEFNNTDLLERVKLELERLKGEPVNLEHLSERDLWTKIPKKMVKLKYISPTNISTQIKGKYIIAGKINVATKNSVKDNIYRNQVLDEVVNNNYTIYRYYKSVDGSGANFYNNTIDIYNEYMVEIEPKKLSKKEYDNNEDNYYDFQKLLDTKTIEDKTYFDTCKLPTNRTV